MPNFGSAPMYRRNVFTIDSSTIRLPSVFTLSGRRHGDHSGRMHLILQDTFLLSDRRSVVSRCSYVLYQRTGRPIEATAGDCESLGAIAPSFFPVRLAHLFHGGMCKKERMAAAPVSKRFPGNVRILFRALAQAGNMFLDVQRHILRGVLPSLISGSDSFRQW